MGTFNTTNTWRRFNCYHTQLSSSYDDYYFVSIILYSNFRTEGVDLKFWYRVFSLFTFVNLDSFARITWRMLYKGDNAWTRLLLMKQKIEVWVLMRTGGRYYPISASREVEVDSCRVFEVLKRPPSTFV